MAIKYKKKPVIIEAVQWTGDNYNEMANFIKSEHYIYPMDVIRIHKREGVMEATIGDFIIKGVKGEFYPCKPDIFHLTYERHLVWEDNI